MTFVAFQTWDVGTDFSFEGRDEAARILGTFHPGEVPPVLTANTLDELERETRAYLGKEPNAILYLTDGDGYVYRIMMNEKHHAAIERARRQTVIAVSLLVFSVTCLPAAVGLGAWAVFAFVGVAGLYGLFLQVGPYREIEAAVVCEFLLILALFLISLGSTGWAYSPYLWAEGPRGFPASHIKLSSTSCATATQVG